MKDSQREESKDIQINKTIDRKISRISSLRSGLWFKFNLKQIDRQVESLPDRQIEGQRDRKKEIQRIKDSQRKARCKEKH